MFHLPWWWNCPLMNLWVVPPPLWGDITEILYNNIFKVKSWDDNPNPKNFMRYRLSKVLKIFLTNFDQWTKEHSCCRFIGCTFHDRYLLLSYISKVFIYIMRPLMHGGLQSKYRASDGSVQTQAQSDKFTGIDSFHLLSIAFLWQ